MQIRLAVTLEISGVLCRKESLERCGKRLISSIVGKVYSWVSEKYANLILFFILFN